MGKGNSRRLGFMRVVEFWYVFEIALSMVALIFTSKDEYAFGAEDYAFLVALVLKSIALWMIIKRKRALRTFLPVACVAEMGFDFVFYVVLSGGTLFDFVFTDIGLIFVALYARFSKRMKRVMVQPFSTETKEAAVKEGMRLWNPRSVIFWRNMVIYFCVFSVAGHWMEAGYCTLIRYGIMPGTYDPTSQIWSDWLYPFMVYGVGFCVCGLLLYPIKLWLEKHVKGALAPFILSFLVNSIMCAAIELGLGLMQNADLQLWDYSNMFMNFMGQICLVNSLMFGSVATLMTWLVYPLLEGALRKIPPEGEKVVFIGVVVLYALLMCFYYIHGDPASIGLHEVNSESAAIEESADSGAASTGAAT